MKIRAISTLTFIFTLVFSAYSQTSWLDRPLNNWNSANASVPNAPRTLAPIDARCRDQIRTPESIADRAVTRAGWQLYGAAYSYSPVTVVVGLADMDRMCRPNLYNAFVFVNNRFAGTLSPEPVNSRSDGALRDIRLSRDSITAEFDRYTRTDPLCCPSQTTSVTYRVSGALVRPGEVATAENCRDGGGVETQDNVVSGSVTYRQRSALPPDSVLVVRLVDVSRQDVTAPVIAEQRIDLNGKQVPVAFDLAYERSRIQERNRYAIQAEIREASRLLYITENSYPVITQGNPRTVEVTVVPVGGGGTGPRQNTVRGTVTYNQRIALPPNSEVTVRLVDSGDPNGTAVAETKVPVGNRQVPIPFELEYQNRDINRQRNYELQAEIRTEGRLRFRTETGVPVTLRGPQADRTVELVLVPASDSPEPVTGRNVSLSKFGTGSLQIAGRNSMFLIRGSVSVDTNGNATVTLSRIDGSISFAGKLIHIDETTLRIAVESSGNATASGEIQVVYSGRSLRSITATNLVLDGQDVTLRF